MSTGSARSLGNRIAGVCAKIGAHTPRTDVVDAANAARQAGADLLVTLGGGSVTDAAKMVGLCLGNGVTEPAQLDDYRAVIAADGTARRPDVQAPAVRSIAIPTTLSAGEFTASAGCTDTARHVKESYSHPLMTPRTVILDPEASRPHPRMAVSVDRHPRRRPCSRGHLLGQRPADLGGGVLPRAAPLGKGLPAVKADPADNEARLDCQIGAWMSMVGSQTGVSKGASHGIGHVLGGTARCAARLHLLHHAAARAALQRTGQRRKQARVSEALGRPDEPAADVVAGLIAGLGLPTRLSDVDVKPEQLDLIAENVDARPLDPHQPAQDRRPGGRSAAARRGLVTCYLVPKRRSPASPRPGRM